MSIDQAPTAEIVASDDDEPIEIADAPLAEAEQTAPKRGSICRPRWGNEKGYIALRDPFTGETHEIAFRDAQPNWKQEVTEGWRQKKQQERGG